MTELLVDYQDYLLFYCRYIGGGIGCWDCSRPNSQFKFNKFITRLNQFGKLRRTNTGFIHSLEFMNLTIRIKNHTQHFKTFQKEHCLYLYIPPLSAHSQEMICGLLIFGRLCAYYKQNTNFSDYINMSHLLVKRLIARGWNWKDIEHNFNAAHNRITGKTQAKHQPYPRTVTHYTRQIPPTRHPTIRPQQHLQNHTGYTCTQPDHHRSIPTKEP